MAKKFANNNKGNSSQKIITSNKNSQFSSNIKTVNPVVSSNKATSSSKAVKNIVNLTHEQVAERAKTIWMNRGCPTNQDEINWFDAESQLKQELGIK